MMALTTGAIANLHSTMFLLIPQVKEEEDDDDDIYIPQCFY